MDIYDYLKLDHQKVDHLFSLFEKAPSEERKSAIIELISKELLTHAQSEQEVFYKTLQHYPETREQALHGAKEHADIKEQLSKIHGLSAGRRDEEVQGLKKIVKHHVKEEEGELFPKAQKVLSAQDAFALKEQMHYLKAKISGESEPSADFLNDYNIRES